MFIQQAIKPGNPFWKYLIGLLIIFAMTAIGQIPFTVAVLAKSVADGNGLIIDQSQLMTILEPNLSLFLLLLSYVFTLGGVFIAARYLHRQSIRSLTTARKKVDWSRILFAFGLWAVFSVVSVGISYTLQPEDFIWNFKPIPFFILLLVGTLMMPIQTSAEEYIFRGYLMQGLGWTGTRLVPLLVTSLIFGGLHYFNPEVAKIGPAIMAYYIGTGLFLGILTLMDEGMELALGFHAANNLIAALLVTSDWTVFQTHSLLRDISEPSAGAEVWLPVVVVFPILLFIFSKKYNWNDWAGKLTGKIDTRPNTNNLNDQRYGSDDTKNPDLP